TSGPLKGKLFGFVNFEEAYIPQTQTRTQTLLTAEGQQGIYRYQTAAGEQRTANLLQLAAQNGFQSTPDPIIAALLVKEAQSREYGVTTTSTSTPLRLETLSWRGPQEQIT